MTASTINGQNVRVEAPASAGIPIGPTIRRYRLGAELRRLREAGGFRLEDVAARLDVAPSTLSRIETGKAPARTSYVLAILDFFGVDDPDERRYLADLAREGQRKGWWAEYDDLLPPGTGAYLGLESAAEAVCTFAVQTIPSLLQTRDYAAAVIRAARALSDKQVDALATATMRRRQLPSGKRELHAILDESALLTQFGSAGVMAEQLDYLSRAAEDPVITIQVLRLATPRQILSPGFTIMRFSDQADKDVCCRTDDNDHITITDDNRTVTSLRNTFARLAAHAESADSSTRLISELAERYGN